MSAQVDVPGVLVTAASIADRLGYDDFEAKCNEARAAMAELIEAANRSLNWLSSYPGEGALPAYEQLRAAVARVQPQ